MITVTISFAQIKTVRDSKSDRFNIGFMISVEPETETRVIITKEDSTVGIVLFDDSLKEREDIVFLFQSVWEEEKANFANDKVISIPLEASGFYNLYLIAKEDTTKEKFMLTK